VHVPSSPAQQRHLGSSVTALRELDGEVVNAQFDVAREAFPPVAAEGLHQALSQFLIASLAMFNVTGSQYPALQQHFRENLPALESQASEVNATLQEKALVLAEKQALAADADELFREGLSLWLPLFFLLPPFLALLVYWVLTKCENIHGSIHRFIPWGGDLNDVDLEAARQGAESDNEDRRGPPPSYEPDNETGVQVEQDITDTRRLLEAARQAAEPGIEESHGLPSYEQAVAAVSGGDITNACRP